MADVIVSGSDVLDNAHISTDSTAGNRGDGTITVSGGSQPFEDDDIVVISAQNLTDDDEITSGSVILDITVYASPEDFQSGTIKYNYAPQNPGQTATVQNDLRGLGDGYVSFNANVLHPKDGGPTLNRLTVAPGKDLADAAQTADGITIDRNEDIDISKDGHGNDALQTSNNQFLVTDYVSSAICFAKGTMILTPDGERAAETLQAGDRVITLDHGTQRLLDTTQTTVAGFGKMAPVRIAAGQFGATRDLLVSQNHRLLCGGPDIQLMFETPQVLVAARHLVGQPGITFAPRTRITYVHLQFPRHEVVWANGCGSQSLFATPKPAPIRAAEFDAQDELLSLSPGLMTAVTSKGYRPARRCLTGREVAALRG